MFEPLGVVSTCLVLLPECVRFVMQLNDVKQFLVIGVTGQELATLEGHSGFIYGVDFSPDGTRLAVAGTGPDVRVWTEDGEGPVRLPARRIWAACFSDPGLTERPWRY